MLDLGHLYEITESYLSSKLDMKVCNSRDNRDLKMINVMGGTKNTRVGNVIQDAVEREN